MIILQSAAYFHCLLFIVSLFFVGRINAEPIDYLSSKVAEKIIKTSKLQYLTLMRQKTDWFTRILEIVKLELNFRSYNLKCKSEDCLYSIRFNQPQSKQKSRLRRSVKKIMNSKLSFASEFNTKRMPSKSDVVFRNLKPFPQVKKTSYVTPISLRFITETTVDNNFTKAVLVKSSLSVMPKKAKHISDCKGEFMNYCKNGAECVYIDLLEEAVCECKKGFTGKRCMDISLSEVVFSLNNHEKSVNMADLPKSEYESLTSVIDATVRFTYNVYVKESEQVKTLLEIT